MAAEYISSETRQIVGANTGSVSITIPGDATMVLVFLSQYIGNSVTTGPAEDLNFTGLTDGLDFSLIIAQRYDASYPSLCISAYRIDSSSPDWPGTGAKTLYYDAVGTSYSEGTNICVAYVKGVDSASPVVHTDSEEANAGTGNFTSSLTGISSGDLSFVAAYDYDTSAPPDAAPTGSGQTAIAALDGGGGIGGSALAVGYEAGESAIRVDSGSAYQAAIAFALKEAGGTSFPEIALAGFGG